MSDIFLSYSREDQATARRFAQAFERTEAAIAHRNRTLVPIMIESCERPIMFELTQAADLSGWSGNSGDKSWCALVDDVRQFVQRHEAGPGNTPRQASKRRIPVPVRIAAVLLLSFAAAEVWWIASRDDAPAAGDAARSRSAAALGADDFQCH